MFLRCHIKSSINATASKFFNGKCEKLMILMLHTKKKYFLPKIWSCYPMNQLIWPIIDIEIKWNENMKINPQRHRQWTKWVRESRGNTYKGADTHVRKAACRMWNQISLWGSAPKRTFTQVHTSSNGLYKFFRDFYRLD